MSLDLNSSVRLFAPRTAQARASRLFQRPANRASLGAVSSSHNLHSSEHRKWLTPAEQTEKKAMKSLHLHDSAESLQKRHTATDDGRLGEAASSRPRSDIATKRLRFK